MANSYGSSDSWDNKYANGDDLNYFGGLIRERVLAKPSSHQTSGSYDEDLDYGLGGGLEWSTHGTSAALRVKGGDGIHVDSTWGVEVDLDTNPWLACVNGKLRFEPDTVTFEYDDYAIGEYINFIGDVKGADWDFQIPIAGSTIGTSTNVPGVIKVGGTADTTNKKYPVYLNTNDVAFVDVPWTDTKVTSVGNHYSPSADTSAKLTANATGATAAWNIDVVKGVEVQRDAKGHVTGLSVVSGKIPNDPNTWRQINVKGTTLFQTDADPNDILNFQDSGSIDVTAVNDSSDPDYGSVYFNIRLKSNSGLAVNPVEGNYGLYVNYGTGLTIGSSGADEGKLIVDTSAIIPNITGTSPIAVSSSGTTKTVSLNYSNQFGVSSGALYLKTATDTLVGGIRVTPMEGNAEAYYTSEKDIVRIHTTDSGSTGRNEHLAIKLATTSGKGVVQLSDSYTSDSTKAATPAAVKAAYDSLKGLIDDLEGIDFQIASSLPSVTTEAQYKQYKGTIYLIPLSNPVDGSTPPDTNQADKDDYYEEFVLIDKGSSYNPRYVWEKIGDTSFTIQNLGQTNVAAIITAAFGF